jgi:cyclic-di-GMP phosphodiesterase TipF (flagellum assembly factor)
MDHVTDLKLEPRELADLGIRYIKVSADLLLERGKAGLDIDPTDLPDLLSRFGIDLIVEKIETERAVVDLLDHDVRFGQGFLFAEPRPLRPENANTGPTAAAVAPSEKSVPAASVSPARTGFPKSEPRLTGYAALARRALSTT